MSWGEYICLKATTVGLLVAMTASGSVVSYAPNSTPISSRCAADLLELLPDVRPIRASVTRTVPYQRSRIAAELAETLKSVAAEISHFQQLVFRHRNSSKPRAMVTVFIAPKPGDVDRIGTLVGSPGHLLLSVPPRLAEKLALGGSYLNEVAEGLVANVHAASFAKTADDRARAMSGIAGQLWWSIDRFVRNSPLPGNSGKASLDNHETNAETIEFHLADVRRPTVHCDGRTAMVTFSPAIVVEWFGRSGWDRSATPAFKFATEALAELIDFACRSAQQNTKPPVFELPFTLSSRVNAGETILFAQRGAMAPRIDGHPYQQLKTLGALYVAVQNTNLVHRRIEIPTEQGVRFLVAASDVDDLTLAILATLGFRLGDWDGQLQYKAVTVVGEPSAFASDGQYLLSKVTDPDEWLMHAQASMRFLDLDSGWSKKQILANVVHQTMLSGTLDATDNVAAVVLPDWMKQTYATARLQRASWTNPQDSLAKASQDPTNWPWAVALLPEEQRSEYVAWLHRVSVERAGRLVQKRLELLRALSPEQVDAKMLGAKP